MTKNEKPMESIDKNDAELSLGERIQKRRKALDLSVEELALLTAYFDLRVEIEKERGMSSQTLYRYEKSEREPAAREIRLLCASLNVSADWLIFGESWNVEQEADTKLANDFRALIVEASENNFSRVFNRNKARNEMHQMKLWEVKNRSKE